MVDSLSGDDLKVLIRRSGLTLDNAATYLGVSRQTLYINLSKSELSPKFKKLVETRLWHHIAEKSPTNDYFSTASGNEKDQLIHSLRQQIKMMEKLIERLEDEIESHHREGKAGARRHST